jgi:hypothetical protein
MGAGAPAVKLLESAVLTRDDTKIWLNINLPMRCKAPNPLPSIAYFTADRRDAELMRLREASKAESEKYTDECWALNRRAWWPVHWGLA